MSVSTENHDYNAYTHGCRCDTCRKAKADYSAARRASGREIGTLAAMRTDIPTHGTRAAYEEHGCRCQECRDRQLARHQADYARKRAKASA